MHRPVLIVPVVETHCYRVSSRPASRTRAINTNASEWIDHPDAGQYLIHEESFQSADGMVLSLLSWEDEQQLIDLDEAEERTEGRRADGAEDW